ncbi:MAG: VCBS repeat-containing protein, partial [bacterium]|nr:VCBS repeat-containing protein [bacterium]
VQVFSFEDDAWTQWASLNIGGVGIGLGVGDMNGDGFPDVISTVQATNRNLRLWISDGQGGFSLQSRTRVGSAARSIALADMNLNGDLDIVVGNAGDEAVMVLDNPRGGEIPQPGRFADGEYFMALNVPNQRRSDPDPVDQLQDLYDAWRTGLDGRVDAVQSSVSGRGVLTLGSSEIFTIELRDLHGNLLDITDPEALQIEVRDSFATAGQPVLSGPGVFEVELFGGDEVGQTRLVVHAGNGDDAVRLMPDFSISVSAFIADFNADGACDFFDVSSYLAAYFSGDIRADIDRDGVINFRDASAFLSSYGVCAGG